MEKIVFNSYDHIFWDFDGVIKESFDIKTISFYEMFLPFGEKIASKVKNHHLENSGISRFKKIPLYLKWAGANPDKQTEQEYLNDFKNRVLQNVIDCPWVKGSEFFLKQNPYKQSFHLITATPQDEIEFILLKLGLNANFLDCCGSPLSKNDAIREIILKRGMNRNKCLMIGDAMADLLAAQDNEIDFLLREHAHNLSILLNTHIQYKIKDLKELYG